MVSFRKSGIIRYVSKADEGLAILYLIENCRVGFIVKSDCLNNRVSCIRWGQRGKGTKT